MAARDLWVRIRADVTGLSAGLAKAQAGVRAFDQSVQKSAARRQAITSVGTAFGKVGLAAAAGLGLSAKAAIDWETAWTGVTKTVDGTTAQMAQLEGQLRSMARELPASHREIAAVAEAAGQLGVAREDIAAFTKVMIDLGETTNLTADEAATSIAQLMNIMQTAPQDVDNLGAALVELGNNGASTERDIVQMAQRLAGAGKIVGMSEADILAVANALASVGIEAEAGGSAVSRIFIDMAKAVKTGNADLSKFADAAQMSVGQFKTLFAESPASAFDAFTKGLAEINKEGGDVFTLLEDLGLSDVRVSRALLGMANSGDLLADSLKTGSEAWKENTALAIEAEKRYETASAKIQVAWNGIKDNMIDIGAVVLPIVADFAESIAGLTEAFSDLPKPVQSGIVKMLALTAVIGGTGFVVSRAITGFANMRNTLTALGGESAKAGAKMVAMRGGMLAVGMGLGMLSGKAHETDKGLGALVDAASFAAIGFGVGGPWGAAIGGAAGLLVGLTKESESATASQEKLAQAAQNTADTLNQVNGALTKNTRAMAAKGLADTGALGVAQKMGIAYKDVLDATLGNDSALKRVKTSMDAFAESQIKAGKWTEKQEADYRLLQDAIGGTSKKIDAQRKKILQMTSALTGVPESVITEFSTPGAKNAEADAVSVARAYKLSPKEVRTILKALDYSTPQIKRILAQLRKLKDKNITITTTYITRRRFERQNPGRSVRSFQGADGAVLDFYANGGENHVAQMAPAGAWRVWAEPETKGESYIPHAPEKRQRSLEIWARTGNILGVPGFADGGMTGGAAGGFDSRTFGQEVANQLAGMSFRLSKDERTLTLIKNHG